MAGNRTNGILGISANFEPQVAGAFDARSVVPTQADLLLAATWQANDGGTYIYVGMTVTVAQDPTPANNGVYILLNVAGYTSISNWKFVGSGGSGNPGATGATGPAGSAGATGFTGASGSSGSDGATGFTGATGLGATGATGSAGSAGATGASGSSGSDGATGFTGATGLGATGATGSDGAVGQQGASGFTGASGFDGATGIGASGATGPQGPAGATGSSAGGGTIIVLDEGTQVGSTGYSTFNFVGDDVLAEDSGTPGQVNIYIPTPTFLPYFNLTNAQGNATVDANLYPFNNTPRISKPTTEGNPFKTGGGSNTLWSAQSNKAAYTSANGSISYATSGQCTGFSADATGDAKIVVTMYDADGTTALETFDTSSVNALYQNQTLTSPSGDISVTISNYAQDLPTKYKASVSVTVVAGDIFTTAGLDGGRYHVEITMTTDTATDGTGSYSYFGPNGNSSTSYNGETNDVFFDTNPSTPAINGSTQIIESSTPGNILTKHLSGVEYYILSSQFEATTTDIDNFNANTQGRSGDSVWNFRAIGTDYGLPTQQLTAWSNAEFTGTNWPDFYNSSDVVWDKNNWAINDSNYRFRNTDGIITSRVSDPWTLTADTESSTGASILIDTYSETGNSTLLRERFDDEQYRLERTGTYTAFVPTATLTGSGLANQTGSSSPFCQACTVGSNIVRPDKFFKDNGDSPSYASLTNALTTYKPDKNGSNPDYSGASYQVTSTYHRLMKTTGSLTDAIASFELEFSGDPLGSTFFNDLVNEDIKVYIRKANEGSGAGNIGYSAIPLSLHGSAPFTTILDPPSGIDTASAACRTTLTNSNTIAGTFGGFDATEGFYIEVQIVNSAIRIDEIVANIVYANGTIVNG